MTQRLIVPVDGSAAAWHAVDIAISLAERLSARVQVLEVAFAPTDVNAARARLEHGAADRQRQGAPVDVEVRLSGDSVASAVEELVLANPGSVVVMASHGRGRSAALLAAWPRTSCTASSVPSSSWAPRWAHDDSTVPSSSRSMVQMNRRRQSRSPLLGQSSSAWHRGSFTSPTRRIVSPRVPASSIRVIRLGSPGSSQRCRTTRSSSRNSTMSTLVAPCPTSQTG